MTTESRAEQIARWEREGLLDPKCQGCQSYYASDLRPIDVRDPRHVLRVCCNQRHGTCPVCWG
jgi:hypothetical protein